MLVSKRAVLRKYALLCRTSQSKRLWSQSTSAHYITNDCDVFGFKELCGAGNWPRKYINRSMIDPTVFRRKRAILPKTAHAQNEYSCDTVDKLILASIDINIHKTSEHNKMTLILITTKQELRIKECIWSTSFISKLVLLCDVRWLLYKSMNPLHIPLFVILIKVFKVKYRF